MLTGAIVLSLALLLIVLIFYQPPKTNEALEADDRLLAQKKGISYDQLIEQRAKKKARAIPKALRKQVFSRDRYQCQQCEATTHLTLDHIFPFSKGRTNTMDNLRVLCLRCNQKKANRY